MNYAMTNIESIELHIAETRKSIAEYRERLEQGGIPAESLWAERERYIGLLETELMYTELLYKATAEAKV